MKPSLLIVFSVLLATGCAQPGPRPSSPPGVAMVAVTDEAYVDRVERLARTRGVDIYWVNPPLKLVAKAN